MLLEFESEKIIAVGTDGRRLAKMEGLARDVGGHPTSDTMTIVPSRSMQLIDRALSEADAEVQLAARANDVLVKTPRATIYSRLVEGRYPRWRDVFPKRTEVVTMDLTVGPLFAAVRQASVVTSDESRGVDFKFGIRHVDSTGKYGRSGSLAGRNAHTVRWGRDTHRAGPSVCGGFLEGVGTRKDGHAGD